MHAGFPVVEYSSNDIMLNGMSKYLLFCRFETMRFVFLWSLFSNLMSNHNIFVIMLVSNRWIWFQRIDWIPSKNCIVCMPYFTYDDYVYFNDIDNITKGYHQLFIHKEDPGMTITPPKKIVGEIKTISYNVCQNNTCPTDTRKCSSRCTIIKN